MNKESISFQIRQVEGRDKTRWLALWSGYLEFYETVLTSEQTELTWNRILDPEFNLESLVVTSENEVVGFAHFLFMPSTWTLVNYCYLEDLFVDSSIRGAGAGRSLIDAVIVAAREKGSGQVYWTTKESNLQARVLYDSFAPASGFVQYRLPQTY